MCKRNLRTHIELKPIDLRRKLREKFGSIERRLSVNNPKNVHSRGAQIDATVNTNGNQDLQYVERLKSYPRCPNCFLLT